MSVRQRAGVFGQHRGFSEQASQSSSKPPPKRPPPWGDEAHPEELMSSRLEALLGEKGRGAQHINIAVGVAGDELGTHSLSGSTPSQRSSPPPFFGE